MRNQDLAVCIIVGATIGVVVLTVLYLVLALLQPTELYYTGDFPYIPRGKH